MCNAFLALFHLISTENGQEWAGTVALEAWQETRVLLSEDLRRLRTQGGVITALDALARRARQVERILEASMVRTHAILFLIFRVCFSCGCKESSVDDRFERGSHHCVLGTFGLNTSISTTSCFVPVTVPRYKCCTCTAVQRNTFLALVHAHRIYELGQRSPCELEESMLSTPSVLYLIRLKMLAGENTIITFLCAASPPPPRRVVLPASGTPVTSQ